MGTLKLEHQILSTIVTSCCKAFNCLHRFVQDYAFSNAIGLVGCTVVLLIWASKSMSKTNQPNHNHGQQQQHQSSQIFKIRATFASIIVALIAFALSSLQIRNGGGQDESLKRIQHADTFYERHPDEYFILHASRRISKDGLAYSNGHWTRKNEIGSGREKERLIQRFRGINLPAKNPFIDSINKNGARNIRNVSFVNKPFPLSEAPKHFHRISHQWGLNLIRLSVTWEAVMPLDPGVIDYEYLTYLKELVALAEGYGLHVIIDPHQDVWSRFTGGDGAPLWTLEMAGFQANQVGTNGINLINETGGAVLSPPKDSGTPPKKMMWTTNYWRLVTSTMFTLFFAGDDYAPGIFVEMENADQDRKSEKNSPNHRINNNDIRNSSNLTIQQFLQTHYLNYLSAVAKTVKDSPNVIGFGTMNEPSSGFVGTTNLNEVSSPTLYGPALSGFDSMRLGSGEALNGSYYSSHFNYEGEVLMNEEGVGVYQSPEMDVWRRVGVYDIVETDGNTGNTERVLRRPDHFALPPGEDVTSKYLIPFFHSVQKVLQNENPNWVTYAEPCFDPTDPYPNAPDFNTNFSFGDSPTLEKSTNDQGHPKMFGWAPHFYDALTLFLGYSHWFSFDFAWNLPVLTPYAIANSFRRNLHRLKYGQSNDKQGEPSNEMHVIVGETGVPYDPDPWQYSRSLDRTLRAMENMDLDYILWCYESSNTDNTEGDKWNGENLSLVSNGTPRGLFSAVRPYPYLYSSRLIIEWQNFDPWKGVYELILRDNIDCFGDVACHAFITLFVPSCHFGDDSEIVSSVADSALKYDGRSQILEWVINVRRVGSSYLLKIKSKK